MEIKYKCHCGGISVYTDPTIKENEIFRGRKEKGTNFLITTEKIATILQQQYRCKKLKRILGI